MQDRDGLRPSKALDLLRHMSRAQAGAAILTRLGSGIVLSWCDHLVIHQAGREIAREVGADIASEFWRLSEKDGTSAFWGSSDLTVHLSGLGSYNPGKDVQVFGLWFNRSDIEAMLPTAPTAPAAATPDARPPEPAAKPKPPVSSADLQKWADVFKVVYAGHVTEALAMRSAQAMFPDHAVSRDRVRALLPERKPGRPASREKCRE